LPLLEGRQAGFLFLGEIAGGLLDFVDNVLRRCLFLLSPCHRGREGDDRGEDDAGVAHGNLLLIGKPD
jgi:hypothetical protein